MSASSLNAVREPVWETPVSGVIAAGTGKPRSGGIVRRTGLDVSAENRWMLSYL